MACRQAVARSSDAQRPARRRAFPKGGNVRMPETPPGIAPLGMRCRRTGARHVQAIALVGYVVVAVEISSGLVPRRRPKGGLSRNE